MKIIHERLKCIGCGSCVAVCEKYFQMADDGLVDLRGAKASGDNFIIEVKNAGCASEAADICPVQVIKVE